MVQAPRVTGTNPQLTLVSIVSNGSVVDKDTLLAEFDQTKEIEACRTAETKHDDLMHQVVQKRGGGRRELRRLDLQAKRHARAPSGGSGSRGGAHPTSQGAVTQ